MAYELTNKDGMVVWKGPSELLAFNLGLLCERFPDEYFRAKAIFFD